MKLQDFIPAIKSGRYVHVDDYTSGANGPRCQNIGNFSIHLILYFYFPTATIVLATILMLPFLVAQLVAQLFNLGIDEFVAFALLLNEFRVARFA